MICLFSYSPCSDPGRHEQETPLKGNLELKTRIYGAGVLNISHYAQPLLEDVVSVRRRLDGDRSPAGLNERGHLLGRDRHVGAVAGGLPCTPPP